MKPETRGAKLLDKVRPSWPSKISVKHLDMGSCEDCILGQLYGHFNDGLERLDLWGTYHELGFSSNADQSLWKRLIANRRKKARA